MLPWVVSTYGELCVHTNESSTVTIYSASKKLMSTRVVVKSKLYSDVLSKLMWLDDTWFSV